MAGQANYPTALDDDVSLYDVADGSSDVLAAHHNNLKEAIKALETKIGIHLTTVPTALDYRLGNPTGSHIHDGASGQGAQIAPSTIQVPSGGFPSGGTLHDRLMKSSDHWILTERVGSLASGQIVGQVRLPFTAQLVGLLGQLRIPASGATTGIDLRAGATSLWISATTSKLQFNPSWYEGRASLGNLTQVTIPSGAILYSQVMHVGSNSPGQDLSITYVFRD